jgi:hypothetical protein
MEFDGIKIRMFPISQDRLKEQRFDVVGKLVKEMETPCSKMFSL